MTDYQIFIYESLTEASRMALSFFGKVSSTIKADDPNQVLTEADLKIGEYLVNQVKEKYPEFNIIDEEAGVVNKQSDFTWVIDPIDGTSNFSAGLPHYGVMMGLLEKGEPIAGGIVLPAFNDIYIAEKGKGVLLNNESLSLSYDKSLKDSLISYGLDGKIDKREQVHEEMKLVEELVQSSRNIRSSNSTYDFAMVIAGKYGAYLNKSSKIWDNVAPQAIIEEIGGQYVDFGGQRITYENPLIRATENFEYCATASKQILDEIMDAVKRVKE
jgi:myo-inositol-1(or 4)-monophosphatase